MQACRPEKLEWGPGSLSQWSPGRGGGESEGHSTDGGGPFVRHGNRRPRGRPAVSSQILVSSDSQSAMGLGTRNGRRLASPGGSHLGQRRGPSQGSPGPLAGQFLDRPAGGAQHLPPTGSRTWQEPLRTQERVLLCKLQPCESRPRDLWAPSQCVFPCPRPGLG